MKFLKTTNILFLSVFVLLLGSSQLFTISAQTDEEPDPSEQLVNIPDPQLRLALEEALGKAAGADITQADMGTLTRFSCSARGVRDLTGLESATNLEYLWAGNSAVMNLSPLTNLTKLKWLDLGRSRIVNVSPLAQLTRLEYLNLSYNQIVDVSSLSQLTRLKELHLAYNQIVDVSPLAQLTRLNKLLLSNNQIVNVSPLAQLRFMYGELDLSDNRIVDVSPFAQTDSYSYFYARLDLSNNQIVDVSPLTNLATKLGALVLRGNPVSDFSPLAESSLWVYGFEVVPETTPESINIPDPVLRRRIAGYLRKNLGDAITQTDMERLSNFSLRARYGKDRIRYGVIRDLTGLEYATNLESIELNNHEISDISPLQNLVNLTSLSLEGNQIVDISPLQNLVNLTSLSLEGNQIVDISPLQNLVNLTSLNLRNNRIANIPLQNLKQLTSLSLAENQIVDISPLENLVNLTDIDFWKNQIVDISPLRNLVNLTSLRLSNNRIVDISPLQNLKQLRDLYLEDNPIVDFSVLDGNNYDRLYTNQRPYIPPVSISDAGLRAVLEEALGKEAGDTITRTDMETLTTLDASNRGIRDLDGIQYAVNITSLNLTDNQIGDPYRIERLTKLTRLELAGNLLATAEGVGHFTSLMPQLTHLDVSRNLISTLYADTFKNPENLTSLNLSDNEIYDVEHLSELTALTSLNLAGNDVQDVSPLAGLTQLTRLFLGNNPVSDFSSLYELVPNLLEADFSYQVAEEQGIAIPDANLRRVLEEALDKAAGDIITQADMETLTRLNASRARIQDLTGLEYAINLKRLDLRRNQISDVSALSGLTKLRRLDLRRNRISDFSSIAGLTDDLNRYRKGNQKTGTSTSAPTINADVNRNGVVDATDLDIVSRYTGTALSSVESGLYPDVDGDGDVDTQDVLAVTNRLPSGPVSSTGQ